MPNLKSHPHHFSLTLSVYLSLALYYVLQSIITFFFFTMARTPQFFLSFHLVSLTVHTLAFVLFKFLYKDLLRRSKIAPFLKVNIPILITFIRISTLPTILFTFIIATKDDRFVIPLLLLVTIASLSDALDGFLARKLQQATSIGAYFDSMGDYAYLTTITAVCLLQGFISKLLGYAILIRLIFQLIVTLIVYLLRKRSPSGTTIIGKITIGSLIVFFNVMILGLLPSLAELSKVLGSVLEWVSFIFIVASTIERVFLFGKDFFEKTPTPP